MLDSADGMGLRVENKVVKRNDVGFREYQIEVLHGLGHEETTGNKEATAGQERLLVSSSWKVQYSWIVVFEYIPLHLVVIRVRLVDVHESRVGNRSTAALLKRLSVFKIHHKKRLMSMDQEEVRALDFHSKDTIAKRVFTSKISHALSW